MVKNSDELPGMLVPERVLANALEILAYWEGRIPKGESLIPQNQAAENEALVLRFYWRTGMAVRRWAYFNMLPDRRGTLRTWHRGHRGGKKRSHGSFSQSLRAIMTKGLKLTDDAPRDASQKSMTASR